MVELVPVSADIAGSGDILHVYLPLDPQLFRRVIAPVTLGFLLAGFDLLAETETDQDPVQ